jgi:hypothetical protein
MGGIGKAYSALTLVVTMAGYGFSAFALRATADGRLTRPL